MLSVVTELAFLTGEKVVFTGWEPDIFVLQLQVKEVGLKTHWASIEIVTENGESVKFNRTRNGKMETCNSRYCHFWLC